MSCTQWEGTIAILILFSDDFKEIFLPLLERTGKVLDNQLEGALALGKEPKVCPACLILYEVLTISQKVFLIGGFGAAVSMRSFLKDHLKRFAEERELSYNIELVLPSVQEW